MKELALIAIQARSGSTRLPNKAFELICGKTMLDRVIETCKKASAHINRNTTNIRTRVVVLTPKGDPIASEFQDRCEVLEGSKFDVLSRYTEAAKLYAADAVVRVTGDCPLLPSFLISKLIMIRDARKYDYLSNTDPRFRTALDGADCEIMSRKMVDYLGDAAKEASDREHVTTYLRKYPPVWGKFGHIVSHFDLSDMKLSVDTQEDLERVRKAFGAFNEKYQQAIQALGQQSVHLF